MQSLPSEGRWLFAHAAPVILAVIIGTTDEASKVIGSQYLEAQLAVFVSSISILLTEIKNAPMSDRPAAAIETDVPAFSN